MFAPVLPRVKPSTDETPAAAFAAPVVETPRVEPHVTATAGVSIEGIAAAPAAPFAEPVVTKPLAAPAPLKTVEPPPSKPAAPIATDVPPPEPAASAAKTPVEARDITELLGDFNLPPVPGAAASRHEPLPETMEGPPRRRFAGWRRWAVAALALVAVGEGAIIAARAYRKPVVPTMGSLSVQTNPPGVEVFVDGVSRGNTPARISLAAGSHILELRGRGVPRVIPVTVTAGAEASQYLELPETPSSGSLLVQSDPAGAKVTVDGVEHGVAPVSVADLAPGEHEVVLQAEGGAPVRQRVVIQAGVTSSVLAPVSTAAPGPVSGWIAVKAPVAIEIFEGGRLIGTTESDRIRATRSIQVPPGKVMPLAIELPRGVINVNAAPWAEVWIDGQRVGDTPIGNLPISIGPHEVVFRHPQFGEKRQAVSVTLKAPVRMSVDMK
jgi:hypothetical protein